MSSDSGEDIVAKRAKYIQSHEEAILSLADEIDVSLEENVRVSSNPNQDIVIDGLVRVLLVEIEDEEAAEELAYTLLNIILGHSRDYVMSLKENGASTHLINFINNLSNKHQFGVNNIRLIRTQGKKYWRSITSDFLIRHDEEIVGIDHSILRGDGKELDLTTSVESNLALAIYLLRQTSQAVDYYGDAAIEQISEGELGEIEDNVEYLRNEIEEIKDE